MNTGYSRPSWMRNRGTLRQPRTLLMSGGEKGSTSHWVILPHTVSRIGATRKAEIHQRRQTTQERLARGTIHYQDCQTNAH